ncbi:MAG: hypothetical protein ACJ07L_12660, partial [Opitutales bacterium]
RKRQSPGSERAEGGVREQRKSFLGSKGRMRGKLSRLLARYLSVESYFLARACAGCPERGVREQEMITGFEASGGIIYDMMRCLG